MQHHDGRAFAAPPEADERLHGHHPSRARARAPRREQPNPPTVRFDVDRQHAGAINNVGRDQLLVNLRQRENFLQTVAATRTKARWLIGIGFGVMALGFAMFGGGVLTMIRRIGSSIGEIPSYDGTDPSAPMPNPLGDMGVTTGVFIAGWALFAVGILVTLVGIVAHVVATSRRRRIDRDYPLP